ncbi:hypothetical protein FSPOR_10307 [Fusarium sporotrichioides]|uniref:Uncharacterized protein n=1 Tax=Fusarium sporotrichioides TaxID=5514 RepID=A0A395RLR3_FUSSP|nr:hypothetical protein FSPOR_10307 [Fusarium sporotrichioides]
MCVKITDKTDCRTCEKNISTSYAYRPCAKALKDNGAFGDCGIIDEIVATGYAECKECEEKRKKAQEGDA